MKLEDLQDAQKMQQFRENEQLRLTGDPNHDDLSVNKMAKLKIALTDDAPEYRELKTEIAMLKRADEKILPELKSCLAFFDAEIARTQGNEIEARGNLNRKLYPQVAQSDIQQLMAEQRKAESRAALAGLTDGQRRKAIEAALQRGDNSLLTAWLDSPIEQSDAGLLRDIQKQYDEVRAASLCQRDFQIARDAEAFAQRVEISVNLALSSVIAWMKGYWATLSTEVRKQILSKPENAAALQRCRISIV